MGHVLLALPNHQRDGLMRGGVSGERNGVAVPLEIPPLCSRRLAACATVRNGWRQRGCRRLAAHDGGRVGRQTLPAGSVTLKVEPSSGWLATAIVPW